MIDECMWRNLKEDLEPAQDSLEARIENQGKDASGKSLSPDEREAMIQVLYTCGVIYDLVIDNFGKTEYGFMDFEEAMQRVEDKF